MNPTTTRLFIDSIERCERKRQHAVVHHQLLFREEWQRLNQSLKLASPSFVTQIAPFVARSLEHSASNVPTVAINTAHHFASVLGHKQRLSSPQNRPEADRSFGVRRHASTHEIPQPRRPPDDAESICCGSLGYAQTPVILRPDANQKCYSAYLSSLE
jgi:hypothetical protein